MEEFELANKMTNKWDIQKHKKVEVFASTSMMLIDDDQTMAKNI